MTCQKYFRAETNTLKNLILSKFVAAARDHSEVLEQARCRTYVLNCNRIQKTPKACLATSYISNNHVPMLRLARLSSETTTILPPFLSKDSSLVQMNRVKDWRVTYHHRESKHYIYSGTWRTRRSSPRLMDSRTWQTRRSLPFL